MIKKFDEFINENIFDGIGKRSKGGAIRKEDEVNLGLPSGTIWTSCNLGASSPEEYGNYYSWGETKPKDNYSWETYKFGTEDNLTKYNEEDGKIILDSEDDAAHVILGGKWHIPTKEQVEELFDNTTNKHSKLNGVEGILFTSKTNGNTLFFPFSGYKKNSSIMGEGECYKYWSSSRNGNFPQCAMLFYSNSYYIPNGAHRYYGFSVRGVLDKK